MKEGIHAEKIDLTQQGLQGTKISFRPKESDIQSAAFKIIVGDPEYTPKGLPVGTILDASTPNSYIEIKHGDSLLSSSYQLRLQLYVSLKEGRQYILRSSRPLSPTFERYITHWGGIIEKID